MVSPFQSHGNGMRVRLDRDDDASVGSQEEALRGRERRALSGSVEVWERVWRRPRARVRVGWLVLLLLFISSSCVFEA